MDSAIILMRAETHVHPGVGQSTDMLDLPVARERTTHYPFIPGSGVKGAFRDWAEHVAGMDDSERNRLFGIGSGEVEESKNSNDGAGALMFSDARLLLLPVRCTTDSFKWVTCPHLLERFARDCTRAGLEEKELAVSLKEGKYLGLNTQDTPLGLEERQFERAGDVPEAEASALGKLLKDVVSDKSLKQRLVILADRDFTWFARYALPVMARNVLDKNKKSENLWYEETLPPETIMYMLVGERKEGSLQDFQHHLSDHPYVQMGGNETIGQGWFRMHDLKAGEYNA